MRQLQELETLAAQSAPVAAGEADWVNRFDLARAGTVKTPRIVAGRFHLTSDGYIYLARP